MIRLVFAAVVGLPTLAAAQDKAAMCVDALEALESVLSDIERLTDAEAAFYNDMVAMRERIGGQDGAALEAEALRHLQDFSTGNTLRAIDQAKESVMGLCSL